MFFFEIREIRFPGAQNEKISSVARYGGKKCHIICVRFLLTYERIGSHDASNNNKLIMIKGICRGLRLLERVFGIRSYDRGVDAAYYYQLTAVNL